MNRREPAANPFELARELTHTNLLRIFANLSRTLANSIANSRESVANPQESVLPVPAYPGPSPGVVNIHTST